MDIIHEKALATILFSIVFIILIGAATPYIQQQISQTNEITDESLKYSKPALDGTNSDFDVDNIPMDDVVSPGPPTSESIALRPPLKTQIYEKDGIITDKHK